MTPTINELIIRSHDKANHLWGGGVTGDLIEGRFDTDPVHAWFQKRHRFFTDRLVGPDHVCRITDERGDHAWKVPIGVRHALRRPLVWSQIATKYPWYITWVSPKTGKRFKRREQSLAAAVVHITTQFQYVDPDASIISRTGYDIPPPLRGKLPHKKLGYWCPCCMTARKFYRIVPPQEFYTMKKVWSPEKQRHVYKERKLAVLKCKVCGITNRDAKFRRSNQPWTVRHLKRGVTRVKRKRRR